MADSSTNVGFTPIDGEIVAFPVEDNSSAVKKAAASSLMWTGSEDALTRVLESMDSQTFEEVACKNADRMPAVLRPQTIAAMRKIIENSEDNPARLRTALDLIKLGEPSLDGVVKDAMSVLTGGDMRNWGSYYIQPSLEYLRKVDPDWAREWVAIQIAEGVIYEHEYWLPFAIPISDGLGPAQK